MSLIIPIKHIDQLRLGMVFIDVSDDPLIGLLSRGSRTHKLDTHLAHVSCIYGEKAKKYVPIYKDNSTYYIGFNGV